jgi:uncharacterized repeat protein (TIGR03803 family)
VLHHFVNDGGNTPIYPYAGLIFDHAGNLYGTSEGGLNAQGAIFELTPNSDGSWTESVLYNFCMFNPCTDGGYPYAGLIFDQSGNLYGTTEVGGVAYDGYGRGTVFELMPNPDGSWTESVIFNSCSIYQCTDGEFPVAGLILDAAGNLYGTASQGGPSDAGAVFELMPNPATGWKEKVLHQFQGRDGSSPVAGLILDAAGNLYGTASQGGASGAGAVFELTPNPNGSWKYKVLHQFQGRDGSSPVAGLIFDAAGNLYGTTAAGGGHRYGVVFKLTPNSKGGWNERVLHTFADHPGASPQASLIFDHAGNLYGTTAGDGKTTFGSVFEITP